MEYSVAVGNRENKIAEEGECVAGLARWSIIGGSNEVHSHRLRGAMHWGYPGVAFVGDSSLNPRLLNISPSGWEHDSR